MTEPTLVPQPHGGALLTGGQPGNKGGPGRPPSRVRALAREAFYEAIPELARVAGAKKGKDKEGTKDRLRAIDLLGKYGLGEAQGLDEEQFEAITLAMARSVQDRIGAALTDEVANRVLTEILGDWKETVRAYRAGAL